MEEKRNYNPWNNLIGLLLPVIIISTALSSFNPARQKPQANQQIVEQTQYRNLINTVLKPMTSEEFNREIIKFTDAIYGEARGEELDTCFTCSTYVGGVIESILTRTRKTGKNISDIVLEKRNGVYQYTCFNPKDPNYKQIQTPFNEKDSVEQEAWVKCYNLAEKALTGKLKLNEELRGVTNYFVGADPRVYRTRKEANDKNIPAWAYEMKDSSFVLDKQGYRIPRKPVAVVQTKLGNAFFYAFEKF